MQTVSASFDKIYSSLILNYDDYRGLVLANTPPRYLIIHGNTTDTNFLSALDSFVLWKRQKGADVDVANTSTSQAGTSNTSIRTYIRNRYNNPATRPDFVILIGDTTGSYAVPHFTNNSGGTDYPYTHMNTTDILGDIFIGRISAENLSQALVLFSKIYTYERDINANTAWLDRMLLVGDWEPSGMSCMYVNKYIKEISQEVHPGYTYTEIYSGAPAPSAMNSAINQGVGIFSFRGYIGMSGWAPPSESSFYNGHMLPHAVIITCSTNNYWNGTGHAELFTRFGSTASPRGAITAIGMSTSSTHTTFNNVVHGAIFDGIFSHGMRTMGEALLHGKLYMHSVFGVSSPTNAEKFTHWANLMGDPTVEVFVGQPGTISLTAPTAIYPGQKLVDVTVRDASNNPISNASVTISQGASIIGRGYTDANGILAVQISQTIGANPCVITVSKHDFKPLQQQLSVNTAGSLVPGVMLISDNNGVVTSGNNDGIINAGENVEITLGLMNTKSTAINSITGTVACSSPYVTISNPQVSFGSISPGATGFIINPILATISHAVPNLSLLRLDLTLSDSQANQYLVSDQTTAYNADVLFVSSSVTSGGNTVLDPGETANFSITIKNSYATTVTDVYGELISLHPMVTVTDNTGYFGALFLNLNVSSTTNFFSLSANSSAIPGMQIPLRLRLYNSLGFEQWLDFSIPVGTASVSTPLGPDAYGYVIYDYMDTAYAECPTYSWMGIAPAEGGSGTSLGLSDAYNSSDEGDQVGSISLAFVDLPFPFKFYGQLYNRITVSSNGFIAMGETANGEFRNFRLPGAMGPHPMIAAFWDDLATVSAGGVYKYYDQANHRYIIEWYNLRNGKNGTSVETFQVILHDQNYHLSPSGDGPIKLQYHTFNNVDSQSGTYHGNYCTVGIMDHTGTRGLEYTFNNQYPTAAATLANGRALYITTMEVPAHTDPFGTPVELPTSMVVTANVQINGQQAAQGDILAAFVDVNGIPQLRGKQGVQVIDGIAGCLIQIYTETSGETVNFKIWQSSSNQVLNCPVTLSTVVNGTIGSWPDNLFIINAAETSAFTVQLTQGWNLVSLNISPADHTITNLTSAIAGNILQIKGIEGVYISGNPYNTLSSLTDGRAYSFKMSTAAAWDVTGIPIPANTPLPLSAGWNMVAYLPQNSLPVATAIQSISPWLQQVKGTDGIYIPDNPYSSLTTMYPGKGYWIQMSSAQSLVYPAGRGKASDLEPASPDPGLVLLPSSMALMARCDWAVAGDYLLARVGGELRGKQALIDLEGFPAALIQIYTDTEGEDITFSILNASGAEISCANTLKSTPNQSIGSYPDFYSLEPMSSGTEPVVPIKTRLQGSYPNPFNPETTISFSIAENNTPVKVNIYNMKGQKVRLLTNQDFARGEYKLIWNGCDDSSLSLASGIYLIELSTPGYRKTLKTVLSK
ncbi:MAG TPA: C25 family cysteine peptidase [Candidatus Cloacimonadota bacterium]|nr:C25 family cysteine peptidase [Candidatus Cloacimonadota bacterium]